MLALVAALLLGYLLKGKAPERKDVVNMELPKSPIQIFPESDAGSEAGQANGDSAAGAGSSSGLAATGAATGAAVADVAGKAAGGVKEAGQSAADAGKKMVGLDGKASTKAEDNIVDEKTGNPSSTRKNIVVDGAGQVVYGTRESGPKDAPAKFDFRTTAGQEVRPAIDGSATLIKSQGESTTAKKAAPTSNAKLIGEKKLPPVGAPAVAATSSKKIASSRNTKTPTPAGKATPADAQKATVAAAPTAGRNKYSVQLLATSSSSKADNLKSTMDKEGYNAFVSTTTHGGKKLYRVRVGNYAGKSAALKVQNAMKRRYRQNQFVQSSIVVRN